MYPFHYRVPKQEDHEIKECATSSLLSKIHILNPIYLCNLLLYVFLTELWDFDEDVIENLTDQEVQEAVTRGIVERWVDEKTPIFYTLD